MNLEYIINKYKNRKSLPEGKYKRFSILIPLILVNKEIHLLFELRSERLNTQPGEICFPGGRIEEKETPMACAIRETSEELNIDTNNIHILGQGDYIVTPFNLILYNYLGLLRDISINDIKFNRDEVSSIFTVPLEYFLKTPPEVYHVETSLNLPESFPFEKIQNGRVYNWRTGKYPILFYEYNDYVIWGMTARIVKNFIEILKD